MVNVVLWLSNKSCSSELALTLAQNNIRIIKDGFSNVDSFIDSFDNLEIVKDVLVVAYTLIQNVDSKKLFEHIRKINPNIRIVIIFPDTAISMLLSSLLSIQKSAVYVISFFLTVDLMWSISLMLSRKENTDEKILRSIHNDRGNATGIEVMVFIMIIAIVLAVMLEVLSIVMVKQKLDLTADRLSRQIQLAGCVNDDTNELFEHMKADFGGAANIIYSIDTTYTAAGTKKIQLGTPFYVTVSADFTLGGIWRLTGIPIKLHSNQVGVSERYWK